MTDLLVRDVEPQALQDLAESAAQQGISREELIRRELRQSARRIHPRRKLAIEDFERSAYLARDLLDPSFVNQMHKL